MEINALRLPGTYEITAIPKRDERGYFQRVYDQKLFDEVGLQTDWVQENQSCSVRKHIIRGLHFQKPPKSETKLVRVVLGAVWDVFVDLRKDSPTFGEWDAIELDAERHNMVYIPQGFAHGFCTLSSTSVVQYKVDNCFAPGQEGGVRWNDPTLMIDWPTSDPFLSPRDQELDFFEDVVSQNPFPWSTAKVGSRIIRRDAGVEMVEAVVELPRHHVS